jgi:hypothetical protein
MCGAVAGLYIYPYVTSILLFLCFTVSLKKTADIRNSVILSLLEQTVCSETVLICHSNYSGKYNITIACKEDEMNWEKFVQTKETQIICSVSLQLFQYN